MWLISYQLTLGVLFSCCCSFANVIGMRLVCGRSFLWGRSRCDHCDEVIPWYALIPILGYLFTRGQCAHCHSPISPYYPLSEWFSLLTGVVWFHHLNNNYCLWVSFFIILAMAAADYQAQWVPDRLQLALLVCFIAYFYITGIRFPLTWRLFDVLLLGSVLLFLATTSKDGIGGADIKLLLLLTSVFGLAATSLLLLVATTLALFTALVQYCRPKKQTIIGLPFVPFIACAYPVMLLIMA
ncbi:MAG: prepilin peptidase [Aerococcus sp.]|nr:prepilin peptidase [Aerococcus sp.]